MGAFQKKIKKFQYRGLNWNKPVDLIPDGQAAFARNVRASKDGEITTRPPLAGFAALGATYIHSMSRLNDFSAEIVYSSFETYVMGADKSIVTGSNNTQLNAGSVQIPLRDGFTRGTSLLSGNPLSMVDSYTGDEHISWKFIGDSVVNVSIGFYPGDNPTVNPARALLMGMLPPAFDPSITLSAGQLTGDYQWACAFRRTFTGARSNPSAASRFSLAHPATTLSSQKATFLLPSSPMDPTTGTGDTNVVVDVYRFGGTVFRWALVGSGPGGSSFTDNVPDANLLAAPSPPSVVDPTTGLSRFSLYAPFVAADIIRSSTTNGTVSNLSNGAWVIATGGSDAFNVGLLPGSQISINGYLFTVYQVINVNLLEIAEDATGILTAGNTYPWTVPSGSLVAGSPCKHLFGVYGTGIQGAVIFGVGNPLAPGTLFWTNGNDPDSMDLANSLVVANASETLQNGAMYNGTAYVWSTERHLQIFPSLSVPGQFYVQEIPGSKGLLMEWSLTTQTNALADVSISWVGKDGIYNFTPGSGTQSLTDGTLYPFFPHDNTQGLTISGIFPWLITENVYAPDFNQTPLNPIPYNSKYHRLTWFDGYLFYDYPMQLAGNYGTLVFDSKIAGNWVSYDLYNNDTTKPKSRMTEIGGNNMKISVGSAIFDYSNMVGSIPPGTWSDQGVAISARLITGADDCGDARAQKLFGDVWLDFAGPDGTTPLTANVITGLISPPGFQTPFSGTLHALGGPTDFRSQQILDLTTANGGLGFLDNTVALDLQWTNQFVFYQWQISYVPKPEVLFLRCLDKTDDGWVGSKDLRGFTVECNTFNVARKVNVLVDGVRINNPLTGTTVFTINSGLNTQAELAFGTAPIVGQEFQLAIDASDASTVGWELFSVRWVWERWPDYAQESSFWMFPAGNTKPAYLRGFSMAIDTGGLPVSFTGRFDDGTTVSLGIFTTVAGVKTVIPFTLTTPKVTHCFRIEPSAPVRCWYGEGNGGLGGNGISWDAETYPESSTESSAIVDCGTVRAKFMQGVVLPLDTSGLPVQLEFVNIDTGLAGFTTPAVTTTGKQVQAFSWPPFIAHLIQIIPLSPARIFIDQASWQWEPTPELARFWTTPPMTHGMSGWLHERLFWVAYLSFADATFTRSFSDGTSETYILPNSNGIFTKAFIPAKPKKSLWFQYSITGGANYLKVFVNDFEIHAKQWGGQDEYRVVKPIGAPSVVQGAGI